MLRRSTFSASMNGEHAHRVSLAKKATAEFLRMSRSSRASPQSLLAQLGHLGQLRRGQTVAYAFVTLGLPDPFPDRGLGELDLAGHVAESGARRSAQLDDLRLELW